MRQTASVYNKDGLLDVWNLHLTDLGARIIESRHKSVDKIREKLALQDHFFAPETINIRYAGCNEISSKATLVDLREQLFKKLSENRAKEIGLGRSLVEPYRGEILLDIFDHRRLLKANGNALAGLPAEAAGPIFSEFRSRSQVHAPLHPECDRASRSGVPVRVA